MIRSLQGRGCCYFLIIIVTYYFVCGYLFSTVRRYTNSGRSWLISFAAHARDLAIRAFCCIFLSPCVYHRTTDTEARVQTSDTHVPRTVYTIIYSSLVPFAVFLPFSHTLDCRSTINYNTDTRRTSAVPRPVVFQ